MTEQAESVVAAETESTVERTNVEHTNTVENTAESVVEQTPDLGEAVTETVVENSAADAIEPVAAESTHDAGDTVAGEEPDVALSNGDSEQSEEELDAEGRVVKLLSVGQKVLGRVKRITDFGAFVDIGVGRDGLIHVSELSVRRVGKVTDVLQENQEVDVWIKKLDRDRNRISLTLIEPGTTTIRDLEKDELVNGTVTRILPYGAFVDIGIGRDALLHIREMSTGYVARPEDVVSVGDEIEARVIELSRRRQRVDLSIKGLRAEPEVEAAAEVEAQAAAAQEPEEEVVDEFADIEVLSPMELAFKRAVEAEGIELKANQKSRKKGKRGRSIQDEIIARTLGVNN
jgi:predicted RNA-binding protein with RPS1 domain